MSLTTTPSRHSLRQRRGRDTVPLRGGDARAPRLTVVTSERRDACGTAAALAAGAAAARQAACKGSTPPAVEFESAAAPVVR